MLNVGIDKEELKEMLNNYESNMDKKLTEALGLFTQSIQQIMQSNDLLRQGYKEMLKSNELLRQGNEELLKSYERIHELYDGRTCKSHAKRMSILEAQINKLETEVMWSQVNTKDKIEGTNKHRINFVKRLKMGRI